MTYSYYPPISQLVADEIASALDQRNKDAR
jgi:hypothetical protein